MTTRSGRCWSAVAAVGALLAPMAVVAATAVPASAEVDGPVHTYRATPGDVASERFTLEANDTDVFVTKYANRSNNRMAVARFASDDETPTLTVATSEPVTSWKIYPERNYPADAVAVDGNTLTFEMSDALRYAIVEVNGKQPGLAIVNDPPEDPADVPDPDAPNVVDASDFVTDLTGATDQTENVEAAIDALYSDDDKDTLYFPDGWYTYAGLELRERAKPVRIYVDEGALLKNRIQPTMYAMEPAIGIWDSANITISGRGVFDGNGFANYDTANGGHRHDAVSSHHQGGAMIVRSENVVFDDTLLRDAKQWNWETHTAKNVTFNNIKGLTPYAQPWADGIDLASGQDLTVNGALTLGNDDTFATGHYNPSDGFTFERCRTHYPDLTAGECEEITAGILDWDTEDSFNIAVNDHLGWSAGAGNGIRIGHVFGYQLRDYTFTNVNYVGFGAGGHGISIANINPSTYPRYESIVLRDSSFDTSKVGTNFAISGKASSDPTDLIGQVVLDNVWFSENKKANVRNVSDLTIKNLTLGGTEVTRLSQTALTFENVVNRNLDFSEDVAPVIDEIEDQEAVVGEELRFEVTASDGDGDEITLSVAKLPQGASFDATSGAFAWTPSRDQVGGHQVEFVATDTFGASSKRSVTITVTDPSATTIRVPVVADTNVQTWNAEERLNYGDNEHLRMLGWGNDTYGPLGSAYTGGESNKDAKLTYLTFDLSDVDDVLADADLLRADLLMTYMGPTKGALSGTDTLRVAQVQAAWEEGDGKTTPPSRTNTVDGAMTWLNKPVVDSGEVLESEPFDVSAPGRVGSDATYGADQKPVGSVARTDVTAWVSALDAGEDMLRLAVNETGKKDIVFVSREGAERNPHAAGMAPVLELTLRNEVDTSDPVAPLDVEVSSRCIAGSVHLAVRATNVGDVPVDVAVETAYGTKEFGAVKAGKSAYQSFATRASQIPAGTVTATGSVVADGHTVRTPHEVAFDAATC
ncbi:putative Ig domain-containing protein [Isoptericola croceus]|uniref:putative Ig domain-containing protein n=1 Tax=Isoptericola croceus TaxID=3031406 RepID=UPI0023F98575|nr:putative Ig domain-containing protein [Isoptericola croceus]